MAELKNATLEGVRIAFRNFSGKEDAFNREGDRNFAVVLDEETANAMRADGWNVKSKPPREEGDDYFHYLQVSLNFKGPRPPRVVMITSRGRTNLPEELVGAIDYAEIDNVDLILNPYNWAVNGKSGIKAYLHAIYVTIREDELERKYAELPDINAPQQKALGAGLSSGSDDFEDLGEQPF